MHVYNCYPECFSCTSALYGTVSWCSTLYHTHYRCCYIIFYKNIIRISCRCHKLCFKLSWQLNNKGLVRLQVIKTVTTKIVVFCDVTMWSPIVYKTTRCYVSQNNVIFPHLAVVTCCSKCYEKKCLNKVGDCLLATVCCLLSTVYYLLSPVYCLLSTVYCLLPAVSCLLAAVYCLLSTTCCLPSTVCCLLSTVY
jgi:hypothetical protein